MPDQASRLDGDTLVGEIDQVATEITMIRLELAGRPANVRDYFAYSRQYEGLRQTARDSGFNVDVGPIARALETLLQTVKDLGRATTSADPETEFARDVHAAE